MWKLVIFTQNTFEVYFKFKKKILCGNFFNLSFLNFTVVIHSHRSQIGIIIVSSSLFMHPFRTIFFTIFEHHREEKKWRRTKEKLFTMPIKHTEKKHFRWLGKNISTSLARAYWWSIESMDRVQKRRRKSLWVIDIEWQ